MKTKEEIVKEIRRYAKENGKTPSEKIFYEYAAIGIYNLKKYPIKYDWKFKGKRDIEMILWKPGINN